MSNAPTPLAYRPGDTLQLQVLRNCDDLLLGQSVTAKIRTVLGTTMSCVMEVTLPIRTRSSSEMRAVLKLYDRRFGRHLREIRAKHAPLRPADEAAFQDFVRRGRVASFIRAVKHEKATADIIPATWQYYDKTPEGQAQFEAALWHECLEHFDCETEAYARLKDLQGFLIPRMYAQIRLAPNSGPSVPADLARQPQTAPYFEVRGILVEHISGYTLADIASSSKAPADPKVWPGVIQTAADAAHSINRRGVIMQDCSPRNVMIDGRTQKPVIIDLAQCLFKDTMVRGWVEMGWAEDRDWDPDVEYWERAAQKDNAAAIGVVLGPTLLKKKGLKLKLKLPDYDKIIDDIERSRTRRRRPGQI